MKELLDSIDEYFELRDEYLDKSFDKIINIKSFIEDLDYDNTIWDVENFILYLKLNDSYTKGLEEDIKFYLKYYNKETVIKK